MCDRKTVPHARSWAILIGLLTGTAYSQYLSATVGLDVTLIEQIGNLASIRIVQPSIPVFKQGAMPDVIASVPQAVTLDLLGLFQTVATDVGFLQPHVARASTRGTQPDRHRNEGLHWLADLKRNPAVTLIDRRRSAERRRQERRSAADPVRAAGRRRRRNDRRRRDDV